jgi:hypothetical protein
MSLPVEEREKRVSGNVRSQEIAFGRNWKRAVDRTRVFRLAELR